MMDEVKWFMIGAALIALGMCAVEGVKSYGKYQIKIAEIQAQERCGKGDLSDE